jgi:hypothetical protein
MPASRLGSRYTDATRGSEDHVSEDGGDDRTSDHIFAGSNRLHYDVAIDQTAKQWWRDHFLAQYGLTPEDVGDALSQSWPGDR